MRAMHAHGFASIPTAQHPGDGLTLTDAFIAAAVRCAPPGNKPTPDEIAACHPHLVAEAAALPRVSIIIGLGRIAFDTAWRLLADRGIDRPAAAAVWPRRGVRDRGRIHGDRLVSPEPAEYEYGKAHAADDGCGVCEGETGDRQGSGLRAQGSGKSIQIHIERLRSECSCLSPEPWALSLSLLRLVDVRRLAEEHLGRFHQRLRQRRMRVDGQLEVGGGRAHLDGQHALRDQLAGAGADDADAEDAFGSRDRSRAWSCRRCDRA